MSTPLIMWYESLVNVIYHFSCQLWTGIWLLVSNLKNNAGKYTRDHSSSTYASFRKTMIFYTLIRTRTCVSAGKKNFSENFMYVVNDSQNTDLILLNGHSTKTKLGTFWGISKNTTSWILLPRMSWSSDRVSLAVLAVFCKGVDYLAFSRLQSIKSIHKILKWW